MINYKDLMIGNWVYESERSKFPMRVVNIGEDYCYLDFEGNEGDVFECKDKDMMPIEVNDKLLKKIGFRRECKEAYIPADDYETFVNNCFIAVRKGETNSIYRDWYCHIDNDRYESIGGFDFQYLHELQNGIRLITKSDLEIKEL
jgi:hypothetical protein